jgi:MFS family permease
MLSTMRDRFRSLGRNARLYLLSNLLQAATTGAIIVVYTLYLDALHYSTDFIGIVLLIATVGGGLGIIPANPLVRRFGYRAMLIWSDLIGGVAIALQILIPAAPVILLTSVGVGASVAIVFVVTTPLLAEYSTPRERTALFGLNNALNFLAGIVGTLLGGFLPDFFSRPEVAHSGVIHALSPLLVTTPGAQPYELAMLVAGALAVPSIIPILLMRETPRALREAPAQSVPSDAEPAPVAVVPPRLPWRKRGVSFLRAARGVASGVIGRFSFAQALLGFGAGLFLPYANLYFVKQLHTSTSYYGALTAAAGTAIAIANLLSAALAARLGKVRGAVIAQSMSLAFLLALAVPQVALASAAYIIRSFLMALTGPPLQAYYMEAVPEESRVLASSVYNVGYQVLFALGGAAGGWLVGVTGYSSAFLAAAPFYATSILLVAIWFGLRRPTPTVVHSY